MPNHRRSSRPFLSLLSRRQLNADFLSLKFSPSCNFLHLLKHLESLQLKAAVLLDLLRVGKGGSSGQAAKQACPSNYPGSATEEIQAPFAAVNSPGDLNQSAGAESFENSFQKARQASQYPLLLPSAFLDAALAAHHVAKGSSVFGFRVKAAPLQR